MGNMDLWNKYATPPTEALKGFDNGNFKGTDISPMWRIRCLTEEFGACGEGWYAEVVEHWTDEAWTSDIERCITTHVRIRLYYKRNGEWSKPVEAVGGNTMTQYSRKYKSTRASDEAYKMAYTDAIGGACKMLGIGGSVYWESGYSKYEGDYLPEQQDGVPQYSKPAPAPNFAPVAEMPLPADTVEDAKYRVLCMRKFKLAALNASCQRKFGTDFRHTPVAAIKELLKPEMLEGMEDLNNE